MNAKDASERLLFLKQLDYVEGGPFAPDFKEALQLGSDALAKLKRYEEREPLVQALIETVQDHDKTNLDVMEAAERVDLFKLT